MEEKKCMCYITYAVPLDKIPQFPGIENNLSACPLHLPEQTAFPPGFVPQWFRNGGFPEDDTD